MREKRQAAALPRLRTQIALACTALTGLVLFAACLIAMRTAIRETQSGAARAFSSQCQTVDALLSADAGIDTEKLLRFAGQNQLLIAVSDGGTLLAFAPGSTEQALSGLLSASGLADGFFSARRNAPQDMDLSLQGQGYRARAAGSTGSGGRWYNTAVFQAKDGTALVRLHGIYAGIFLGGLLLLAGIARLLSRQMVRPAEAAQREQLRFFAGASHELKSPLAVIASAADMLSGGLGSPAEQCQCIRTEIDQMARLIDDMLVLSNSGAGGWALRCRTVQPEDSVFSAFEAYSGLMARKGQHLRMELPDSAVPALCADEQRLRQILTILLDNACRYASPHQEIVLRLSQAGKTVLFQVTDHGPGIPDTEKEQIFRYFYQANFSAKQKPSASQESCPSGHFGLGLAVARELARLHSGDLTVSNTPGGGTTFTLSVPVPSEKRRAARHETRLS